MRKLRNIFRILLSIVLGIYLSLLVLVNFGPAGEWLTYVVQQQLEQTLKTQVEIGKVELGLFNSVTLHDVNIEDRAGRPMIQAGLLSTKVEVMAILRGDITLRTVALLDGDIHLDKAKADTATNLQFLIDAFASKEKKEPSKLNLCINSIILRRCHFSYDARYLPHHSERLDPAHLDISHIDANISLKRLTPDSLNLRVRALSFSERSGLRVKSMRGRLAAGRSGGHLEDFHLALAESQINIPHLRAIYDGRNVQTIWQTIETHGTLPKAHIATDDVAPLFPVVKHLHQQVDVAADYDFSANRWAIRNIVVQTPSASIVTEGYVVMNRRDGRIVDCEMALHRGHLRHSAITYIVSALASSLPKADILHHTLWGQLGDVDITGRIHYVPAGKSHVKGQVITGVGRMDAEITNQGKKWMGQVHIEDAMPDLLLGKKQSFPTHIYMSANGSVDLSAALPHIQGSATVEKMQYGTHHFGQIAIKGTWTGRSIDATLHSQDPMANLDATIAARHDGHRWLNLRAMARVQRIVPSALGWQHPRVNGRVFSAQIDVDAPRPQWPDGEASVKVKDFYMTGSDTCYVPYMNVAVQPSRRGEYLKFDSDFAHFELDGPLTASAIYSFWDGIKEKTETKTVSVAHATKDRMNSSTKPSAEWEFQGKCSDTEFFNKVLGIPVGVEGTAFLEGRIGGERRQMLISLHSPSLSYGSVHVDRPSIYVRGEEGKEYSLLARGSRRSGNAEMLFELTAQTHADSLTTALAWQDSGNHHYGGEIRTTTHKSETSNGGWVTRFHPTDVTIHDTVWHVMPGSVSMADGKLHISGVGMHHDAQSLTVAGSLTRQSHDRIVAQLRSIDIDYILSMLNVKPVAFAGNATGEVTLSGRLDSLSVQTSDLDIPAFHFNGALLGHAHIKGGWNQYDGRIRLDADIRESGVGYTLVNGYISPGSKELELKVNNQNTNVAFLDRYVGGIFGPIEGRVTGNCRIHGKFSTIDFEGTERGSIQTEILATGVQYSLSGGTVCMTPGVFDFSNFSISDNRGGEGTLSGQLGHTHLKNIRYQFTVDADRLRVYDKPQSLDMPFYATAVGTGRIQLSGFPGSFSADIRMRPDRPTQFYYIVDSPQSFGDGRLVRFADADSVAEVRRQAHDEGKIIVEQENVGTAQTDIRLDFTIDMKPEAKLFVIMDEKTGDKIELGGTGILSAKYYNKGDFTLNGNFVVADGNYKMSIQDVIRKEFTFAPGGNINFTGNPFESDLNLQAIYTVPSVSLSDLNIGSNLSENSVPVNCVLNFGGKVGNPQVTFDLDLPRASDDIRRMVRSLISSEGDDINMQVLYLLGVGRFYTYDFASTEAAESQSQSAVAMRSFLSNTLSSQLNSILSDAMGTTHWTVGANVSTGSMGWSDVEVEGLLSGRLLDDRLIINGNFGYRDRPQYSNTNFVGDFNIRYLLTPGGGVSLKAYSETNDRYFSKSSLTTQGAGVELKRSFTNLRDLFRINRRRGKVKQKKNP